MPLTVEIKLFHFHRIFKNREQVGGSSEPPEPSGSATVVCNHLACDCMAFGLAWVLGTNPVGVMVWYAMFECGTSLRIQSLRSFSILQKAGKDLHVLFEH